MEIECITLTCTILCITYLLNRYKHTNKSVLHKIRDRRYKIECNTLKIYYIQSILWKKLFLTCVFRFNRYKEVNL